jgi:tetratricopeptide (TPR) repeat protein
VAQEAQISLEKTRYFLEKVYAYRGLGDGSVPLSETVRMVMSNYASGYIQIVFNMRQSMAQLQNEVAAGEKALSDAVSRNDSTTLRELKEALEAKQNEYDSMIDMVVSLLDQCVAIMPWDWRPRLMRQEVLMSSNRRLESAMKRIDESLRVDPDQKEFQKIKARLLELSGDRKSAQTMLEGLLQTEPDAWESYAGIVSGYEELGLYDSALIMARQFQKMYPVDKRAVDMIARLEQRKHAAEKKSTDSSEAGKNKRGGDNG